LIHSTLKTSDPESMGCILPLIIVLPLKTCFPPTHSPPCLERETGHSRSFAYLSSATTYPRDVPSGVPETSETIQDLNKQLKGAPRTWTTERTSGKRWKDKRGEDEERGKDETRKDGQDGREKEVEAEGRQ
jgi:hypothetical protein